MAILCPALSFAFAAFCIWLAVRIINLRERRELWERLANLALAGVFLLLWILGVYACKLAFGE